MKGLTMKKVVLTVVAAMVAGAAPALAADMPVKGKPPVIAAAPPSPWDVAFGGAVMSDYNFRGVSQSNRGPSATAYFESQYNGAFGQLYSGIAGWAINWPSGAGYGFTDPTAEIDLYGGWRKTWDKVSLDIGYIYYYYPKELFNGATNDSDFLEVYGKLGYAFTPDLSVGGNVFYTPDLLHYSKTFAAAGVSAKAEAIYGSFTLKWVTPLKSGDFGTYISGEVGHWWIDKKGWIMTGFTDPSYTYWNAGLAITYKALTLDLRYHGTDQSVADCNSFLLVTPGNLSSKWCKDAFIVSLKVDSALSALKPPAP
jgi:uncharacterized protein (TIGR02001 family)